MDTVQRVEVLEQTLTEIGKRVEELDGSTTLLNCQVEELQRIRARIVFAVWAIPLVLTVLTGVTWLSIPSIARGAAETRAQEIATKWVEDNGFVTLKQEAERHVESLRDSVDAATIHLERLEGADDRLKGVQTDLGEIQARLDATDKRIDALERALQQVSAKAKEAEESLRSYRNATLTIYLYDDAEYNRDGRTGNDVWKWSSRLEDLDGRGIRDFGTWLAETSRTPANDKTSSMKIELTRR